MGLEISAKRKERELIIKLSHDGKTYREIASLLGISKSKASYWNQRYAETNNLKDKPRSGRPTTLSKERLQQISETIRTMMQKQEYLQGISSREARDIIENETGKRYSLRHIRRLLHTMEFSLRTPRAYRRKKAKNRYQGKFRGIPNKPVWTAI